MRAKTAITANTARKKEGCVAFANDDFENARRVKYYWEIIADNLSKATAKSLSPYRQLHFSRSGALWGYAEGLDTNVQKLPMTCWPDHPPFGNQKRF
jgi:hypothetical protein